MSSMYIYALADPITDEVKYVGATHDIHYRYRKHLTDRDEARRYDWIPKLLSAGLKPSISVLQTVDSASWQEAERYWIARYRVIGCGALVNKLPGGIGGCLPGYRHTLENRERMKGRVVGAEARRKISEKNKGRCPSEETRRKLSAAGMGRVLTAEDRQKIRDSKIGHVVTEETRRRISETKRLRREAKLLKA